MKLKIYSIFFLLLSVALISLVNSCSKPSQTRKTVLIGRDTTWYPLTVMGKEQSLQGFMDELLLSVAAKHNLEVIFVPTSANQLIDRLEMGSLDVVISNLQPTHSNQEAFEFSDPLFLTGPVLVTPINSTITQLKQLERKSIGVRVSSSTTLNLLKSSSMTVVPYDSLTTAMNSLTLGQTDALLVDALPAYALISSLYKGKLKIATSPLTNEGLRLITLKDPEGERLIKVVNEELILLKENGTFNTLLKRWDLFDPTKAGQEKEQGLAL